MRLLHADCVELLKIRQCFCFFLNLSITHSPSLNRANACNIYSPVNVQKYCLTSPFSKLVRCNVSQRRDKNLKRENYLVPFLLTAFLGIAARSHWYRVFFLLVFIFLWLAARSVHYIIPFFILWFAFSYLLRPKKLKRDRHRREKKTHISFKTNDYFRRPLRTSHRVLMSRDGNLGKWSLPLPPPSVCLPPLPGLL